MGLLGGIAGSNETIIYLKGIGNKFIFLSIFILGNNGRSTEGKPVFMRSQRL